MDSAKIEEILGLINAGGESPALLAELRTLLRNSSIRIDGERNLAVRGDVSNSQITTGDNSPIITVEGAAAEAVRRLLFYSPAQLREACGKVSGRLSAKIIGGRSLVRRPPIERRIDAFLSSPAFATFLLGYSGVGKSISLAIEAVRLQEAGWAVLLMSGRTFSLNYLAEVIAIEGLGHASAPDWRQLLVKVWSDELPHNLRGFVLLIDALNDAPPQHIAEEILKLKSAVEQAVPAGRFKLIGSCHELAWETLSRKIDLPSSLSRPGEMGEPHTGQTINVGDFERDELDTALRDLGAFSLLSAIPPGEAPDPQVEVVRDLIKHPATFEHYAELLRSGSFSTLQNLTWSGLVERRVAIALERAAGICGVGVATLRERLIDFAKIAWEQKAPDYKLDAEDAQRALPSLNVESLESMHSPYAALVEAGLLVEFTGPNARRLLGFRISDAGSYLLSFALARQAEDKTHGLSKEKAQEKAREQADAWLREAWSYSPLFDAMMAWTDRLADNPTDNWLLAILDALIDSRLFRHSVVFRLLRPVVVAALFELLKMKDDAYVYDYKEVAQFLRPSPESLTEIRRRLRDRDARARQLAAYLIGEHCDLNAIRELIELLDDEDEVVLEEVYHAFGRFGRSAVGPLVEALRVPRGGELPSTRFRQHYLVALRNVGIRNQSISAAISDCLRDARENIDMDLERSALMAALQLRDKSQRVYAESALQTPDWSIAAGAIKLLEEIGEESSLPHLLEALEAWCTNEGENHVREWVIPRLMRTIIGSMPEEKAEECATPELQKILKILEESLNGGWPLDAADAVKAAAKLDWHCATRLLVKELAAPLRPQSRTSGHIWSIVEKLGRKWRRSDLEALEETGRMIVEGKGVDVVKELARVFRDAVLAGDNEVLHDHDLQDSTLLTMAKCQSPGFAAAAGKLLENARPYFGMEVCEALWVASDAQAEKALLDRLEELYTSEREIAWRERSHVVRALGTCGATKEAEEAFLSFLGREQSILQELHKEAAVPMIVRGRLHCDRLETLARDTGACAGRIVALLALCVTDAKGHTQLFRDIAFNAEENIFLRGYAIYSMGVARDAGKVTELRRLLRQTDNPHLASRSAQALAMMSESAAITEIESALSEFAAAREAEWLVSALAHFREASSLPVLLHARDKCRWLQVRYAINEALAAFWERAEGRRLIDERVELWRNSEPLLFDDQAPLVEGLLRHAPGYLMKHAIELYDGGHLDDGARLALSRHVLSLYRSEEVERAALIELLKRLLRDRALSVRERAAQHLSELDQALCAEIYQNLFYAPEADEWTRASAAATLGYWECDESEIDTARYDEELLVRHAGDSALQKRRRRRDLLKLIGVYNSPDGATRLAAYLSLKEHADEHLLRSLHMSVPEVAPGSIFLNQLSKDAGERIRKERAKREEEERRGSNSRAVIHFD